MLGNIFSIEDVRVADVSQRRVNYAQAAPVALEQQLCEPKCVIPLMIGHMIQATRSDGHVSTALEVDALQVLQHTKGAGNTVLRYDSLSFH